MRTVAFWFVVATLAWGVLAIGGVYPWGYFPLAAAAAAAGILGLWSGGPGRPRELAAVLGLVALSIGIQLLPLQIAVLGSVSPATSEALRQLDPRFAAGLATAHPVSLYPAATQRALLLFSAFALLLVGTTHLLSKSGAERLIRVIVILGVLVAFAGIVQKSFLTNKIYGVWTPVHHGALFGPFVNRNHFAGWMLMVLPLTLGLFSAGVARGMRGVKPELRDRFLWFSSPEASKLLLIALAASIMLLALVLTFSRSGFLAGALSVLLTGAFFLRGGTSDARKVLFGLFLMLMACGVVSWVGTDAISDRFAQSGAAELGVRAGAWEDAWEVARHFPLTGTGVNCYSATMLLYQRHSLNVHFSAAHNDYLQLAAEGGLLVCIPILAGCAMVIVQVRRRLREDRGLSYYWLRAGAVVALVTIGAQEFVDFSLQIPANAVMFAVICAIAIHKKPERNVFGHRSSVVENT